MEDRYLGVAWRIAVSASVVAVFAWSALGWPSSGVDAYEGTGIIVVGKGTIGPHHWLVKLTGDGVRKGICMETSAYLRHPRAGGTGMGTCSAPAVHRGLITSVVEKGQKGTPTLTALGAGFNLAVRRVEVSLFNGRLERFQLRRIRRAGTAGKQVTHFRYVAEAKAGVWCMRTLVTRDKAGVVLWRAAGAEVLPYDPARVCRASKAASGPRGAGA
jgi:hypothetical protein